MQDQRDADEVAGDGATPEGVAPGGIDGGVLDSRIAEIIAEFSEVFAYARTRWARFAEEVHPELKGVGMIVLQFIVKKGPVTATRIAQMLDMDKAMVSRQVSKLRELGMIDAEPAPEDRRVVLLTASTSAVELLDGLRDRWAHGYHERFRGWTLDELEVMRDGLHRFNATADLSMPDGPAARCVREQGETAGAEAS